MELDNEIKQRIEALYGYIKAGGKFSKHPVGTNECLKAICANADAYVNIDSDIDVPGWVKSLKEESREEVVCGIMGTAESLMTELNVKSKHLGTVAVSETFDIGNNRIRISVSRIPRRDL